MTETQTAENSTPPDTAAMQKMGKIIVGYQPRTKTFFSHWIVGGGGIIVSALGAFIAMDRVTAFFKEDTSKYERSAHAIDPFDDDLWQPFKNAVKRALDIKLWKSNLTFITVLIGGGALAAVATRKVEEHTFRKHVGNSPRVIKEVNDILDGALDKAAVAPSTTATNWQKKTQKSTAPETGVGL